MACAELAAGPGRGKRGSGAFIKKKKKMIQSQSGANPINQETGTNRAQMPLMNAGGDGGYYLLYSNPPPPPQPALPPDLLTPFLH